MHWEVYFQRLKGHYVICYVQYCLSRSRPTAGQTLLCCCLAILRYKTCQVTVSSDFRDRSGSASQRRDSDGGEREPRSGREPCKSPVVTRPSTGPTSSDARCDPSPLVPSPSALKIKPSTSSSETAVRPSVPQPPVLPPTQTRRELGCSPRHR